MQSTYETISFPVKNMEKIFLANVTVLKYGDFQQVLAGLEDKTEVIVHENEWRDNFNALIQTLLGQGSTLHSDL